MEFYKKYNRTFLAILISGVLSVPLTLISPSEAESVFWMGISKSRLLILAVQLLAILLVALVFLIGNRKKFTSPLFSGISKIVTQPANYATVRHLLFGFSLFLSLTFFFFSIFIPQALSAFSGWMAFSAWMLFRLFVRTIPSPQGFQSTRFSSLFPSWKSLTPAQKRTTLVLLSIGFVYFCLFIPLNLRDSASLNNLSPDELAVYPVVVKMLSSQPDLRMSLYHFFSYGAYIYGFPHFGYSALLLLPVKLIFGEGWTNHLQLNMLLLRQFVNVLPSILACFLFTYLATRFKKFWPSLIIFALLLTLPEVIILNYTAWHPDFVNLFFVALTLYYLDRDQLSFGANFYFAAITCGLSVATRLFGLFFFLAVAGLLTAGCLKKILSIRKALITGVFFISLMVGTILAADSYLFNPGEPAAAMRSFQHQSETIAHGVDEPDPEGVYRTGITAWWPTMTRFYGSPITLGFLGVSLIVGVFGAGRRVFHRILFAWLLVIGVYLIGFVAVKSPWYLMSFLMPLYCAALAIPENLLTLIENLKNKPGLESILRICIVVLVLGLGVYQIVENFEALLTIISG